MAVPPVRDRTRREVLDQALRLFAAKGYGATTLQDIASKVGCSKPTVLYHFADKAAILGEVLRPTSEQLTAMVDQAALLPPTEAQAFTITGFVELVVRHRGLVAVMSEVDPNSTGPAELVTLIDAGRRLPALLAATDNSIEQDVALFAIHGALAGCADTEDQPDDVLRALLLTALRRLLRPA